MDEGKGEQGRGVQTQDETRKNGEQRKMVAAQRARESLHSRGSHRKEGG